jgi:hypothetical protein
VATPDPDNPGQRTEASYTAMKQYVDKVYQVVINALKEKQVIIKEGDVYRLYDVFLEHHPRYFG